MVIENAPKNEPPTSTTENENESRKSSFDEAEFESKSPYPKFEKPTQKYQKKDSNLSQIKKYKSKNMDAYLKTRKTEVESWYILRAIVRDVEYKHCVEIVKNEKNWNPLLMESQLDPYSNTRKERYRIPGKQEKMFRFVEQELIEMHLENQKPNSESQLECPDTTHKLASTDLVNNKMSVETMPSEFSSCVTEGQKMAV
jgi:hypothetical protein